MNRTRTAFNAPIEPALGGPGLALTRERLHGWLAESGVREPDLHRILIAAGEACSNAVEHSGARRRGVDPQAWIRATCDETRVHVVMADRGRWKEPNPTDALTGRRGRGRLIMFGLVDHVAIHAGPNGTTVELVQERTPKEGTPTPTDPGGGP